MSIFTVLRPVVKKASWCKFYDGIIKEKIWKQCINAAVSATEEMSNRTKEIQFRPYTQRKDKKFKEERACIDRKTGSINIYGLEIKCWSRWKKLEKCSIFLKHVVKIF